MDGTPLEILYFAWMRERVGLAAERVLVPPEVATLGELVAWLAARDAGHAAAFDNPRLVRAALNQAFAPLDARFAAGDEIAFFPPVTGG